MISALPATETIAALLNHAAQEWPDRPFLRVRTGETVTDRTFAQVRAAVAALALELRRLGIQPGDGVALGSENSIEWVVAYLAITCSRAVAIPLDSQAAPGEILHVLERSSAKLLLHSRKFADALATAGRPVPCATRLLTPLELDSPTGAGGDDVLAAAPEDLAVILFTSGTTGFAKGVMLTHRNLVSDAVGSAARLTIFASDNLLLLLPLHHTYSSTVNILVTLRGGAHATLATSYKSRDIVDDIRIGHVTILPGVPQIYENLMLAIQRSVSAAPLLKRSAVSLFGSIARMGSYVGLSFGKPLFASLRAKAGLSGIRLFASGGASLRPEVNRYFRELGFDLIQGYGLTETSPVLTFNSPAANRIGSVGRAIQGVELRIDRADANGIGEICARGPMIMRGYFDDPESTANVLRDGWLHTGDAGRLDRRGYLYITGRLKNIIVTSGGKNIYPEEIESRLDQSPYVLESLVFGVERQKGGGEELRALIVPDLASITALRESGTDVDIAAEMKKTVDDYNATVPVYRQIRRWQIHDTEFEKTALRKIRRFKYTSLE
ncbi:AMP-binding protein [candidate division KSB1 bacterium]|nr:AMP-binding protein [candidate division KSB1 bacterium]